jgi:hypothetical protein
MSTERGSTRWMLDRFKTGFDQTFIEQLVKFADGETIKLGDVWIKGQPPRIDEFMASYFVATKSVGSIIDRMFGTKEGIPWHVLIRGQPPRLNMVEVVFRTPGY